MTNVHNIFQMAIKYVSIFLSKASPWTLPMFKRWFDRILRLVAWVGVVSICCRNCLVSTTIFHPGANVMISFLEKQWPDYFCALIDVSRDKIFRFLRKCFFCWNPNIDPRQLHTRDFKDGCVHEVPMYVVMRRERLRKDSECPRSIRRQQTFRSVLPDGVFSNQKSKFG
jgi:hypothetical protein